MANILWAALDGMWKLYTAATSANYDDYFCILREVGHRRYAHRYQYESVFILSLGNRRARIIG
jgi:hypothetical protein